MAPAEVHALVGENGAGKSTLLNVVMGVTASDGGQMFWEGRPVEVRNPRDARRLGITFVHQELALVPQLSVAENVFLGRHPARTGWVSWDDIQKRTAQIFEELGHPIDVQRPVAGMGLAERQLIEVARAFAFDARLIILDEPTAALSEADAERLRRTIHRLRARGVSFIFVSHRLKEVIDVADRITVLREGRTVVSSPSAGTDEDHLVRAMAGSSFRERTPRLRGENTAEEVLRICGPIDLQLRRGEVVGLAGAAGGGCSELLEWLFGSGPQPAQVFVAGRKVTLASPRDAIRHGLALVPDDRAEKAVIPAASLQANIMLAAIRRRFFIDQREERRKSGEFVVKLRIRAERLDQPAASLSGGDQQKMVLARWLHAGAQVLLLDQPTRGVDLRSKAEIHELIRQLAGRGTAVLLTSSNIDDLLNAADRIVVLHRGRIAGELTSAMATEERILQLATGVGM